MNDIEQKFQAGFMAHSRMFLAEAEQQYRQVLTVSPSHVGALHLLGVVYLQRGEFNAAVPLLCRSIELKPEFAEAHNNLGMTLQQIHRFFDAEACYRRALLLNADLVEAHNNLGFLLQNMERPREAEES
jgi:Flp pilus assembly protein TadD